MRAVIATVMAVCLLGAMALPTTAEARPTANEVSDITLDVLVFRPAGLLSTIVGTALFVPAVIFTWPNGRAGIDQAWEHFVTVPYESTFRRDLGDW